VPSRPPTPIAASLRAAAVAGGDRKHAADDEDAPRVPREEPAGRRAGHEHRDDEGGEQEVREEPIDPLDGSEERGQGEHRDGL